ncbi:TylF/MycF/NovP-related O-methyltransferase [Roseicyclus sp.]|uniref:TylF/MycF/NovP-related O-methyltransferase n=1 Tax=Roseicyclus sp. TaxID=1914329 RepID=UPI003FA0DBEE
MNALRKHLRRLKGGKSGHPLERWRAKPLDRSAQKALHLLDAMNETRGLSGSIVECGVGSGYSLALFAMMLDGHGDTRALWAFDSFEGFPKGSDRDAAWFSPDRMEIYKAFDVSWVRTFIAELTGNPALADRPRYVEGFFPATFERYDGGPVSLLHLDVDLYQSYVDCFDFFAPRLQPGAMILLDEYDRGNDETKWPGAKLAADEFAARHGLTIEKHFSGFVHMRIPGTLQAR